jgi:16S rRNA (guanine966-N2)-methyltransferase
MRIVGGRFMGKDLMSPNDFRVRPTAEMVRAQVMARISADIPNASVLDLFAGTGALGLEAISRGARRCDFVENRPASLHSLKANIVSLGQKGFTRVFKKDALPFAAALGPGSYDLTFVDPPYGSRMLDRVIDSWLATQFSRVLVAEHTKGHVLPAPTERWTFDDTEISVYRIPA